MFKIFKKNVHEILGKLCRSAENIWLKESKNTFARSDVVLILKKLERK